MTGGWFEEALAWLVEHASENLGTEIALRAAADRRGSDVALAFRAGGELTGVSVCAPGGQWFLEADSAGAVAELVGAVLAADRSVADWPVKVTTSQPVKGWLRPLLAGRGVTPVREHDLLAMVCRKAPGGAEGRWATHADRAPLERYQALYNKERHTTVTPDWDVVLSHPTIAVLEDEGRIVAVVKRTADTARYATIGGTWTEAALRGRGFATRLTAFLVSELLSERPAVHLIVDDDNTAAIALYRSLDFEEVGSCSMAYLGALHSPDISIASHTAGDNGRGQ